MSRCLTTTKSDHLVCLATEVVPVECAVPWQTKGQRSRLRSGVLGVLKWFLTKAFESSDPYQYCWFSVHSSGRILIDQLSRTLTFLGAHPMT